jgi:hypothetical protein
MVTRRPGGPDGPEDVDAAFAEIVADLEREGLGSWLAEEEERLGTAAAAPPREEPPTSPTPLPPVVNPPPAAPPAAWRAPDTAWPWTDGAEPPSADPADEHFVPPEPPPPPRLKAGTLLAILLIMIGVALLVLPSAAGLDERIGLPIALLSMAAGIGWLLLRIRQGPPPDDDGAQL